MIGFAHVAVIHMNQKTSTGRRPERIEVMNSQFVVVGKHVININGITLVTKWQLNAERYQEF
jgi:hypothetical protein